MNKRELRTYSIVWLLVLVAFGLLMWFLIVPSALATGITLPPPMSMAQVAALQPVPPYISVPSQQGPQPLAIPMSLIKGRLRGGVNLHVPRPCSNMRTLGCTISELIVTDDSTDIYVKFDYVPTGRMPCLFGDGLAVDFQLFHTADYLTYQDSYPASPQGAYVDCASLSLMGSGGDFYITAMDNMVPTSTYGQRATIKWPKFRKPGLQPSAPFPPQPDCSKPPSTYTTNTGWQLNTDVGGDGWSDGGTTTDSISFTVKYSPSVSFPGDIVKLGADGSITITLTMLTKTSILHQVGRQEHYIKTNDNGNCRWQFVWRKVCTQLWQFKHSEWSPLTRAYMKPIIVILKACGIGIPLLPPDTKTQSPKYDERLMCSITYAG